MEVKKNPNKDLLRSRPQYFALGMVISLSLAITAFEWRTEQGEIVIDTFDLDAWAEDEIFSTIQEPPKPPPRQVAIAPIVVETKEEVEPQVELIFDLHDLDPEEEYIPVEIEEEPVEVIHDIVEEMPSPEGGMEAFYKFLSKKMKYPKQARRMGIEGKVYIQFVVDTDGQMNEIKVVRGVGAGCDEEALRVMGLAPSWNPGKQRGRPVKVRMVVPIHFRLSN